MTAFENIQLEIEQQIAYITLNRPEVRNALDAKMQQELEKAFNYVENQQEVRIVVVQGAGGKAFAAGADIKVLHERLTLDALVPGMQGLYSKIEQCTKVTIAVINGYALGGGCELAMACDLRIATEKAKFGLPELNLGIIPGAGGTQRLPRLIGKGRALDLILTGRMIDGVEAERIGLVNYYTTGEELDKTLASVTNAILKKGPVALQLAKFAVNRGADVDMQTAQWMEKLSTAVLFGTEDKEEGTRAFMEKRDAVFINK